MADRDHFERLGLPRRFRLDPAELERRFVAASRAAHPDHVGETAETLEAAARVNQAYFILKDAWKRADYLLTLAGGPCAAEVNQPPLEFLEEMLELRMEIEEAKHEKALKSDLQRRLQSRREEMLLDVERDFDRQSEQPLKATREKLNAIKFINGLLRDLNEDCPCTT